MTTLLLLAAILTCPGAETFRNTEELNRSEFRDEDVGKTFDLTGRVVIPGTDPRPYHFFLSDGSGAIRLSRKPGLPARDFLAGNDIHAKGRIIRSPDGNHSPQVEEVTVLRVNPPDKPTETDIPSIRAGRLTGRFVRFRGIVRDIQEDDVDPNWAVFTLTDDGEAICASLCTDKGPGPELSRHLGAEVEITGFCNLLPLGHRHFLGSGVDIVGPDGLTVITPPPQDPFGAPPLADIRNATPRSLLALGYRTTTGRVLAICRSKETIIRTHEGGISHVRFISGDPPRIGDCIDVAGFPCTDLYRLNLQHARWRKSSATDIPDGQPVRKVTAATILTSGDGRRRIKSGFHGSQIRIDGDVLTLPSAENDDAILRIRNGGFIVPVDISACPEVLADVTVGCTVGITGVCLLQQGKSPSASPFVPLTGFTVVMRSSRDLEVLARPPWWTPSRLIAVIGTLLAILLGIGIWNFMLRRLAERRGRELAAENVARAESDLRVYERTRLAVELHDSIAQNLSGVSLELDAARDFGGENPKEMSRHLDIAARTLKSCRGELRNCMWDLRNQTLEDERMDDAIRRTLAPHLGGASLAVRFDVPRERLSDNTALAILRIIRELTVNAVRHGHAKLIHVAGCVEDGKLMFSVRDDGCGFDPESRPGIEEGHFGLQGVNERIEGFNGGISISSTPEHGAKITVTIPIPGACAVQGEKT